MDQIVIDTGAESFPVGTSATVFGPDWGATPTIQDCARWAGTIPHVVVKPASAGSSFGVALARDASQLRDALRCAARFDDRILIEGVVPGREIDVAVLRETDGHRRVSPPLEIQTPTACSTPSRSTTVQPGSVCPPTSTAQAGQP
jgi:D-alanine-D-alanine ligase-like ATP-grasp enzyme